jgi:magnesium transporter
MEKELVSVRVTDDREKVAQEMARFDLLAIPVVDEDNRLVGIVTHDDVIDVVVQEATEDVHRMGAVEPMAENYLEAHFATIWRKRAFWLACLFGAELFTFTALSHFEDAIAEVVVLSLFVPLCISTGGNSGSQAATLITRAIALGQLGPSSWLRVLRHELFMGLALGVTLGMIGFVRGALTPEEVRKNPTVRHEAFQVRVPHDRLLEVNEKERTAELLPETELTTTEQHRATVTWPEDTNLQVDDSDPKVRVYTFPAKCTVRHQAVSRWDLAYVIAMAVAGICLWGTLVGSMLPIIFCRLGVDPGVASSPFVATFVDVTGIIIYFSIAKMLLL